MASGSSAPKIPATCMALGDIIHVLGRPRCGLCCGFLKLSYKGYIQSIKSTVKQAGIELGLNQAETVSLELTN